MDKFVFLSYKSDDRDLIRPYRDLFDSLGIKYWWDDQINQDWSKEIDEKLNECAAVVGFLTERSNDSNPAYAECHMACEANKFIPVKLDKSPMKFHWNSLLALRNYVDLSNASQQKNEGEKLRLIKKIEYFVGTPLQIHQQLVIPRDQPAFSGQDWINPERLPHIAYLVSLCVFKDQNHDRLQLNSALLERKFIEAGLDKLLQLNTSLTSKHSMLKLIGAESVKYASETRQHEGDFIRFENHEFSEKLLLYIWDELDQLRSPIILWIEELIDQIGRAHV